MKIKLDTFDKLQKRIIQGDKKAMARFVELTYSGVFQTAFRITRNIEDAEDTSQNAFARFFGSLENFKEKSSLKTWLYRITVNCAIDAIRARKTKTVELNEEFINIERPTFLKTIENKELSRKIQGVIKKLGPQQRAVFTLKYFDGLKFDQIAEIMEISPSTAKTHFYRAIMNFKKSLQDYTEE